MDQVKTISPTPPGSTRALFFGFAPILPASATITNPTVTIAGGFTASGSPAIGVYNPATKVWTADPAGQWVRQQFTAGPDAGPGYRIDCTVDIGGGANETVSLLAPVGWSS